MIKDWKRKVSKSGIITIGVVMIVIIAIIIGLLNKKQINTKQEKVIADSELARAMTYNQFEDGDENIDGTDNVKFGAFFLRDINNDGYAEKLKGTCKQVGKEDTLYMELNVLTDGYLENGKISINSDNFYLQTAIPKDNEVKENIVSNNAKQIALNRINNGTQKLLTGIIRSGDYSYDYSKQSAIGNDPSKYSKINTITLTGTHVASDGTRTEINKTIDLNIDWYGTVKTEIPNYIAGEYNINQNKSNANVVDEENQQAIFEFNITMQETKNELLLSKACLEGTLPQLNGYDPLKVEVADIVDTEIIYDQATRKFTATKTSKVNADGSASPCYDGEGYTGKYNRFRLKVTYPLEAYRSTGMDTVELKIPIKAYYEGYNNPNEEFSNPYKSNVAENTIVLTYSRPIGTAAKFDVYVGKYEYNPSYKWIVSKKKPLKIYNGMSSEENDDTYIVRWNVTTGNTGEDTSMIMKETKNNEAQVSDEFVKTDSSTESMENITSNIGIYFSNPVNLLGEDGWIKIYDDEADILVHEFNKNDWQKYSENNPYMYETPIKHIRVETSGTKVNSSINVYNVKKLDDEYITSNYERDDFDNLKYIKSTLTGYMGQDYINTDIHNADYEAPFSYATVSVSKDTISTQETEKNMEIKIEAIAKENSNQEKWVNGDFLLKLPQDVVNIDINSVTVNDSNVAINSYETYENQGERFVKINTSNNVPTTYEITINCNITPDPRKETVSENFELYASNENASDYYYASEDIYDVNNNLNISEKVNKYTLPINLISPNSLLTNQVATNYNDEGNITIAPNIAIVSKDRRNATVSVEINNNYSSTISEIMILGRVPYKGNKYTVSGGDMGSTFTVEMSDKGIQLPEDLQAIAKVYYSENGEATKDLTDSGNDWTQTPADFSKVKSYLIDFGNYQMPKNERKNITYDIKIPEGVKYNEITYSHHVTYFSLDTTDGKYRTYTEPNKVGFMIAKQYDLELTKFQKGKSNIVSGATYAIYEEGKEEKSTKVTGEDGKLKLTGLYIDRTYVVKEIKSPNNYELNEEVVKFTASENDGKISVIKNEGNVKNITAVQPSEDEGYKVELEVEDEVKARLKINKTENGTTIPVSRAKYKITGSGLPDSGRNITTSINGEAIISGLKIGQEYTLEEIKAEGYYVEKGQIKFTITNTEGTYEINVSEGTPKDSTITEENNIPTAIIKLEDEKIPTYDLEISKTKRITDTAVTEDELMAKAEKVLSSEDTVYLSGAKFQLYY